MFQVDALSGPEECKFLSDLIVLHVSVVVKSGLEFGLVHILWSDFVLNLFCGVVSRRVFF